MADQPMHTNVVVIIADDLAWGDLGCHGNPATHTTNLDALHRQSTRLTRYCSGPMCTPARSALMTGRHPFRTKAFDTYLGRSMIDPGERLLPELFRDEGYTCGIFGKWHLGDCHPMRPNDRGFDESLVHRGGGLRQPANIGRDSYFDPDLVHNGELRRFPGYCTDIFTEGAIEFISRHRDTPFFCYLATNAPHSPFEIGDEWVVPHRAAGVPERWARLYGMIDNIDWNVGRLLATLDSLNLDDRTIVVFTSDHGPCGSARINGEDRFNAGLRGRKGQLYEGGIRVPMFWRWPGRIESGHDVDRIANPIDVLPTLADLCEIKPPSDQPVDGVSLGPLLTSAVEPNAWPERAICMQWHRGDEPQLFRNAATITQRWKWYWPADAAGPELYDLAVDTAEQHDVLAEHPELAEHLQATYVDWFADVSSTRPDNYAPPRIAVGTPAEPTTWLTRQDWRLYDGVSEGWGPDRPGYWLISVARAGMYRIVVEPDGRDAGELRFRCGATTFSCSSESLLSLTFTAQLAAGPQRLEAYVENGRRVGVRTVSLTPLGSLRLS